jgi:hypothetical protein
MAPGLTLLKKIKKEALVKKKCGHRTVLIFFHRRKRDPSGPRGLLGRGA